MFVNTEANNSADLLCHVFCFILATKITNCSFHSSNASAFYSIKHYVLFPVVKINVAKTPIVEGNTNDRSRLSVSLLPGSVISQFTVLLKEKKTLSHFHCISIFLWQTHFWVLILLLFSICEEQSQHTDHTFLELCFIFQQDRVR